MNGGIWTRVGCPEAVLLWEYLLLLILKCLDPSSEMSYGPAIREYQQYLHYRRPLENETICERVQSDWLDWYAWPRTIYISEWW